MKAGIKIMLFAFTLLLSTGCKKKVINHKPLLNILSPGEMTVFNYNDLVTIGVSASDDINLNYIKASILNESESPVLPAQVYHLSAMSAEKTFEFNLTGKNLPGGAYYILVEAYDGELTTRVFRKISILVTPIYRLGFIVAELNINATTLHQLDTEGNQLREKSYTGDFLDGKLNSKENLFYSVGEYTGDLSAYSLDDLSLQWGVSGGNSTNIKYFTGLNMDDDKIYASYSIGKLSGYAFNGANNFTAYTEQGIYYPTCMALNADYICTYQQPVSGLSPKKITVYYKSSAAVAKELVVNEEIIHWFNSGNNQFSFVTKTGAGGSTIGVYDLASNSVSYSVNFGEIPLYVVQVNDNEFMVSFENEIKQVFLNGTIAPFINETGITSVAFDEIASELILGTFANQVKIFDFPSGSLKRIFSLGYTPGFIAIQYSE